jgi:septum formation protein
MSRKIILASQSPRRKQLLQQIGLEDFEIQESAYKEDMTLNKSPRKLAEFLAFQKAKDVARRYKEAIVIGGDSIIFLDGKIYGKAKDKQEAVKMLQLFSGKKVGCVSGLAIIDIKNGKRIVTHGVGWLQFRKLSLKEIEKYVRKEDNILGVAGGFNIVNKGAVLIDSIEGDFYSIVGLPVTKLYLGLKELGVDILSFV